jgi:microcompartment protein CcmK/EutM
MRLGQVTGEAYGSKQVAGLSGCKLLVVRPVRLREGRIEAHADGTIPLGDTEVVAVDALHAGVGDLVLVAHGSRVRDLTVGSRVPVKDVIVAVVDAAEVSSWS